MNNADALSVLLCGHIVGSHIYPALANRGIKMPTTYKFAIGSALGASAIAWALFVEYLIHSTYKQTGEQVCILWQAASYVMIGAGEIFAVSAGKSISEKKLALRFQIYARYAWVTSQIESFSGTCFNSGCCLCSVRGCIHSQST